MLPTANHLSSLAVKRYMDIHIPFFNAYEVSCRARTEDLLYNRPFQAWLIRPMIGFPDPKIRRKRFN